MTWCSIGAVAKAFIPPGAVGMARQKSLVKMARVFGSFTEDEPSKQLKHSCEQHLAMRRFYPETSMSRRFFRSSSVYRVGSRLRTLRRRKGLPKTEKIQSQAVMKMSPEVEQQAERSQLSPPRAKLLQIGARALGRRDQAYG